MEISEICLLLEILTVVMTQDFKTTKIWTEQKTERFQYGLKGKVKISKISEFSILPYPQDQKLGNLRNFVYLWILILIVIQDLKMPKNELRQKLKGSDMI